jgi:rhamnose utilization protein RhaD (predicted bifunctional aldolase and dehydrogenase)/NAD(P)-dependent dehydrogenase (short-subunit alcohol dehydrogenase family)
MKNLWDSQEAKAYSHSDLAMRVYTSRLLGRDADLVLHGGGNTSVKSTITNILGDQEDILFVKGSGWDLLTIEEAGFSPARLKILQRLGQLPRMTDTDMARELKASMTNPSAPAPSVEAILHALIPHKFVDHTHTDAVIAVSNSPQGEALLKKIYGPRVLILPYVMPGFILSKQVYKATKNIDWKTIDGIFLLHHGLFTFHEEAKTSYDNMIALVNKAEDYLKSVSAFDAMAKGHYTPERQDVLQLALVRQQASKLFGYPMIASWKRDELPVGYSAMKNIESIATRGPVTPDHTLHTKRIAMIMENDPVASVEKFAREYKEYFSRNTDGKLTCLDLAPRFAVWKNKGCIVFGPNAKRARIVSDILDHTIKAVQWGEKLGGWTALTEKEIFELEYWELEQAKLKSAPSRGEFEGRVVLVTGAASGIGLACAKAFLQKGAVVAAVDINSVVTELFRADNARGIVCDMADESSIIKAVQECVMAFGGLDVVVSNAGVFPPSLNIEAMDSASLQKSLTLNFSSHVSLMRECTPYLKMGFDPSIILMASKNVPAPGPGAGAYSAAKAALTQMGRVAAMELGADGIRVNMLHPNAVFDTGVWSEEVLKKRAEHYGMSVETYKTNNVLKTEITAADVAKLVVTMAGPAFAKTTGAQVPIDGGNDRVI